jgi:CheY-like chemotaxis protein
MEMELTTRDPLELARADFDLEVVLREAVGRCEPRAEERGCGVVVEVRPEVPPGWRGDPTRLGQLLEALVGYAVEHSEALEVRVLLERAVASTGLLVAISGFTPPLSVDELGRLFESAPLGRTPWPTGPASLALARSRRLVQLLKGELGVDGSGGVVQGVRLFLPLEVCALPPGPWSPGELDGLRTLVVDESEASRRAVEGVLAPWAFEVTPARSGALGLRAVEDAARAGRPFELVLVSSRMERVPSLEFVRRARLLMGPWGRALVVVLATSGDRERLLRAGSAEGVDAIVERPVLRARLLGVLAQLQQVQRKVKAQHGR